MSLTRKYDFMIYSIILLMMVLERGEAFITATCVTNIAEVENMFDLNYSEFELVSVYRIQKCVLLMLLIF